MDYDPKWTHELSEDQLRWAIDTAEWRAKKTGRGVTPKSVLTAKAETAAALLLGVGMNANPWEIAQHGALDFGIHVKAVDNSRYGLGFGDNDILGRAYVCALVQGNRVYLRGWERFTEAVQARCEQRQFGSAVFYVLADIHLQPMAAMEARLAELKASCGYDEKKDSTNPA